jgi:hypothetical protein
MTIYFHKTLPDLELSKVCEGLNLHNRLAKRFDGMPETVLESLPIMSGNDVVVGPALKWLLIRSEVRHARSCLRERSRQRCPI